VADDETHADLGKALIGAIDKYVGNPAAAEHMRETLGQLAEMKGRSTSAQLRQTQQDLAASQADLTATRGTVVDLLYIIDAFQIESGADRNASAQTGIEAVRRLRGERDEARAEAKEWRATAELYLAQRDDALHDLAVARFHHAHCTTEEKP